MAGEALTEELALDISPALDALGPLGTALDDIVAGFGAGLADAISAAIGQPIDSTVTVEGDTGPLTTAVDEATSATAILPVDADTTGAKEAIGALEGESVTLSVEADTIAAQESIDGLTSSVDKATGASGGGEGLAGLEGALVGVKAATGAASGGVGEVSASVGELGGASTAAVLGGGAAFVGFLTESINLASDAQAQNRRFADTFGDLADQVREINVGGLNTSLEELGKKSGTANANLEATATRIGQLGQSSGASGPQIVSTTQNLLALGATIAVNNPRLGDAASVTDRLTNAFARGGRALAPFGIALSAAQINAEALRETGKSTAADLTLFEKSTAGANLALATFGDTLGTKFTQGASNAQVQFRALKTEVEESLVALGTPLLQPAVDTFTAFVPIAVEVGQVLGNTAQIVLPFVAALAPAVGALAAPLKFMADGLGVIAEGVDALPEPVLLGIAAGVTAIAIAAGAADGVIVALGGALALLEGPVGLVVGGLTALGVFADAFAESGDNATTVAKDLGDALFGEVQKVDDLAKAVADLNDNLTEFDTSAAGLAKDAPLVADALKTTGITAADLNAGIQGSAQQFDALRDRLRGAAPDLSAWGISVDDITGTTARWQQVLQNIPPQLRQQATTFRNTTLQLNDLRTGYQDSVKAQLQFIETSGAISKAQLDTLLADAASGAITYTEALKQGTAASTQFAEQQSQTALQTATASGALADLQAQVLAGTLSAADAEAALEGLGIGADDAKAAIDPLAQAMKSFVDATAAALPGAKNALDDWTKNVEADFQAAADAQSKHETTAKGLFDKLNQDSDPATFTANLLTEIKSIQDFQTNIDNLSKTAPALAKFFAEQGPAAAGGLAAGFASSPVKAKAAEAALGLVGTLSTETANDFGRRFGPEVQAEAERQAELIGSGFSTGIAAGITSPTSLAHITAAGIAAANTAEFAAKRRLGISSPSKVGIEIGAQFVEGVVIGFNDPATIAAASQKLADALAAGVANAQKAAVQSAAQQQIDQFVSAAVGQLPDASNAFSTFSSTVSTDLANVNTALDASKRAHHEYAMAVGETSAARQKLARDIAAGAPTRTIFLDQDAVNRATADEAKAKAALAKPDAALDRAQAALAKATDPTAFIRDLTKQTAASKRFLSDLKTLTAEGFDDLAKELATAGPDVAGKLADGFASSKGKAKQAEAAIDAANAFATSYKSTITDLLSPTATTSPAVAIGGPTQPVAVAGSLPTGAAPTFQFALAIDMGDGTTRTANVEFTPTPLQLTNSSRLVQKVRATVSAR